MLDKAVLYLAKCLFLSLAVANYVGTTETV